MSTKRTIQRTTGLGVWLVAASLLAGSVYTIRANITRPADVLLLTLPENARLMAGDGVFLTTDSGLRYVGEVRRFLPASHTAALALNPDAFSALNEGTIARCWQTPLTAEETIPALLPRAVRERIGAQIAADWATHEAALAQTWNPIVGDLIAAYFDTIGEDLEAALQRFEPQLWDIATTHGRAFSEAWPSIQDRLGPILEKHLTPVLGRLMNDAITEAPKVAIAWNVARGQNDQAFKTMLDWLGRYLATMSDKDKRRLEKAVHETWLAARGDSVLAAQLAALGRGVYEDPVLRRVAAEIYRDAVADNPRTASFIRREILESQTVRRQLYALVETLAPTAKRVLAICLFDSSGRTRREVVQFVRSAALNRRVSWVTLEPSHSLTAPQLHAGATLNVALQGSHP